VNTNKLFTKEQLNEAYQNGLSYQTLYTRVFCYEWDIDRAIHTPTQNKFGNNQSKFPQETVRIAEQNGISLSALYNRIRRGWTIERALHEPIHENYRRGVNAV
jgi:hypothetical protein